MHRHVIATCALLCAASAHADLVIDQAQGLVLDVTAAIGEGTSTAYAVIDFGATGGSSWALAYSWNGDATGHDMLSAFQTHLSLDYDWTDWGSGYFVDNFSFAGDVGDPANYWAHSLATPDGSGTVDWADAWSGVETTALSDGLLSGWYNGFNEDFSAITPTLPLTTIPAPSAAVLLLLGLKGRRRRC
mgnify:CR=1 FL=1